MRQEHRSIGFVFESPEASMSVSEPDYGDPQGSLKSQLSSRSPTMAKLHCDVLPEYWVTRPQG